MMLFISRPAVICERLQCISRSIGWMKAPNP